MPQKGRGSTKFTSKHGGKRRKRAGGRFGSKWQGTACGGHPLRCACALPFWAPAPACRADPLCSRRLPLPAATRLRQVGDGADYLEGWQGSRRRCFKCGGSGHFARDCTAEAQAQADAGALAGSGSDGESGGDAATRGGTPAGPPQQQQQQQQRQQAAPVAGGALRCASAASLPAAAGSPLPDPAEEHAAVLADPSEAALTGVLTPVFGHAAFRGLQLPTMQRLLGGESLLSIMPTGMGKSLCYQVRPGCPQLAAEHWLALPPQLAASLLMPPLVSRRPRPSPCPLLHLARSCRRCCCLASRSSSRP